FLRASNSVSQGLVAVGVGHGDRVAVLSQNNPEWCMTFWGTVDIGAVLVGLNGWWNTDEILYGLEDSGAKVLVADRRRFERIAGDLAGLPALETVFLVDADPAEFDAPTGGAVLRRFDELTATPTDEFPQVPIDEADHAVIFYTSGTTGRPKGAISTHRSMVANLQNTVFLVTMDSMTLPPAAAGAPSAPVPASLFTSPLFHVSGCHSSLVVGMMGGLKLVMIEGRFEPEKALSLIQDEKITTWATVPTMIWRTCEWPGRHDYDTSTIATVSFGGSPSADELQRMIRETFPNVRTTANAYGLTESSSVATVLGSADAEGRADSVGRPVPTVDIAIAAPDGTHLGPGETGEVLIRGPIIMPGYWNKPEATASAIRDGWLWTGDVGHLDEEGFLFITDRAKDMLIRGGENVYCVEIEQRLVEHPAIADAAIIGVPHPELGEEVKAVIEVASGEEISDDQVRTWVADALAPFKVPAYVERWPDKLPRNASGKLLKNVLRGEGEVSFAETM
ncbi:MAG TPA: class I adenylate-forming enzyme family protein, partial [Microthrixaceae bacterium]|nr:class I adenylate-forming enzyme family protein [Microthrixaceae bacterium]